MFKPRSSQGSFLDVDYLCESLIPPDSFYKKFREVVAPLIKDEDFEGMYCMETGRPLTAQSRGSYFLRSWSRLTSRSVSS